MLPYRENASVVLLNPKNELLLVHDSNHDEWKLPKGGIEEGETLVVAARRELREETGITELEVIGTPEMEYCFDWPEELQRKRGKRGQRCHFVVARTEQSPTRLQLEEVDDYLWLPYEQALRKFTHQDIVPVMQRLREYF